MSHITIDSVEAFIVGLIVGFSLGAWLIDREWRKR